MSFRRIRQGVLLAAIVATPAAVAQSVIEGELVQAGNVSESRNPVALVSGGNVMALMSEAALAASGPGVSRGDRISFVVALSAPGDALCIRLRSRDEGYRGEVNFQAEGASAGWHRVTFATAHADYLAALDADELLVGAFLGPDCDELFPDRTTFVPVALGEDLSAPLYLLANTRNNNAVIVSLSNDGSETERACEAVSGEMSRAVFQRKCPVGDPGAARLLVEASDGFGGVLWREWISISWPHQAR